MKTSGRSSRQVFFDPADYAQLAPIRDAYPVIREEGRKVMNLLAHRDFLFGDTLTPRAAGFTGTWARFYLHYCGMNMRVNRELCPATTAVTDRLPGRVTSGFYLLGPQAHVEPHVGICENIKRCHLGLICPPECTFRIGNERRTWREGEMLVFDDTIEHEAWNRSDAMRVVLHLDFFDPPDQDAASCERTLRKIREINITSKNGSDHLWLSAVGVELDDDLSAIVEASVDRAKSRPEGIRRVAAVNNLVATCGFFY